MIPPSRSEADGTPLPPVNRDGRGDDAVFGHDVVGDRPRRRRLSRGLRIGLWIVVPLALLSSLVVASALVKVPYWSFSPGAIRDTAGVVRVGGAETYPVEGSISFTTVSIRGRLSVAELAIGWIDPDTTIVHESEFLVDRDADQNRQINMQLMDSSTQTASYVALDRLGYEVTIRGTGAIVVNVVEGAPAEGIIEPGDTIVSVDGMAVSLANDLVETISERPPGTQVVLGVVPLGTDEVDEREVTLAARDDDPTKAFLGVSPVTRNESFEFPSAISIDFATGGVGGPSAGLAFTLTLLDQLSPGDLTGGLDIAATGTIDRAGNVGPIGGLEQKAIAVRRQGVPIFLVPARTPEDELREVYRLAGDSVQIVPVETLSDALEALVSAGGDPLPTG